MQEAPDRPEGYARPASGLPLWPLAIFAILAALFGLALRGGDPSRLPSALIGRPVPTVTPPAAVRAPRSTV